MLVSVLTVKRNNPVTLSKHEATRSKEKGNDHAFPVSWMWGNFLEDFREFYSLAMDTKASPITEKEESSFRPAEESNSGSKNRSEDFYPPNSKRDNC